MVELGSDAVNAARVSVNAAARAVSDARDETAREERLWSEAAQLFGEGVVRVSDLDEQSAHLRTLRHRADAAARHLERALLEERRCAAALVKAAMEHRKLELWRDRICQDEREEEQRQEQRRSDELAARTRRVRA